MRPAMTYIQYSYGTVSSSADLTYSLNNDIKSKEKDSLCQLLPDEKSIDFDAKPTCPFGICSIDLIIVYPKLFHLLVAVIFCSITTKCTDSKAPLKVQMKK
jgi:hypothetical protein